MSHHTRGRKAAPQPIADAIKTVPPAPKHFHPAAKAEWRRIMPVLVERRVLSVADLHAAERFCEAQADIVEAREAIAADGAYVLNRLDEKKRHPAFATLRESTAESRRWAAELGLTPSSRSRAGVHEDVDDGDDNPLDVA
jgi:P27 family predicted phage terminase small subunit